MSVTAAAERLGVGRPALSNLLNGNATLSPEMAVRLEKAFGADRQKLLDIQASSETEDRRKQEKTVAVRAYVPNFLSIKARQIAEWPSANLDARNQLPVLLRRLIHSTGHDLRRVDFPGYDNAQRRGWNGWVEAEAATPWIPEGQSGWEFGTDEDPRAKAEKDYKARLSSVPSAERAGCTLITVTPRNWPGKTEWARKKAAAGEWKAVRALDASDLEQWLEESIPAQMWLAEKLGRPVNGFETLERCWDRWMEASDPPMAPEIFEPSIAAYHSMFKAWLEKPSERVFVVSADSKDEALAFLACLFRDADIPAQSSDLATVFESPQALRSLASSSSPFIPIVYTEDTQRELVALYRRLHCIVIRPRNAVDSQPDIALDLLGHEAFEKALAAMGLKDDEAERLERASGRSPTILRRQLSKIAAIRTPRWASDTQAARCLVPMALVGAWHANSTADCEVLSALAGCCYPEIEECLARLLQFDDCPVWSVGQYRGVASKLDAMFAIGASMTNHDLATFFKVARSVLSEPDPALELPEDERWAAGAYGKVRNHSATLRQGICETLVILSVHGNTLFRNRLGFDANAQVSVLIQRLLTPMTLEKLLSHENDLPRFAEAAPDEFLKLFEADLKTPAPVVLGLLKPAGSGLFSGCPRTGLLWGLECLAWKHLGRVTALLAQLSRTRIDDNWVNKPIGSLQAIYRSWVPQTAASVDDRMKSLEVLTRRFPDIGWQICIEQFDPHSRIGHFSYKPHWRSDASSAGQPATPGENYKFCRKALDLALAWLTHDEKTLGDLVERLDGISDKDQASVWDLVDAWSAGGAKDEAKAELRERIRRFAFTRRGRLRGLKAATRDRARAAYDTLVPRNPVIRHAWLFAKHWVEESADETGDHALDHDKREERIHRLRADALKEIWTSEGFAGVAALLSGSEAPQVVGRYAALCATDTAAEFVRSCLAAGEEERRFDGFIEGLLQAVGEGIRRTILLELADGTETDLMVRLFRCAPFTDETWRILDGQDAQVQEKYWQEVVPTWFRHTDAELTEITDRLLDAKRPRAAFFAIHMDWDKIETSRLKRLLSAMAASDQERDGSYRLEAHDISMALASLNGRTGVSRDEMAHLEFLYLRALDHSEHGIPNLERQMSESPALFAQAVGLTFKSSNDGEDPPEWRIDDSERRGAVALATHRLLDQVRRIPGTSDDGKISAEALVRWLVEARRLCEQYGRGPIGDQCIGQILSRAPADESGAHPCLAVCEAMEAIAAPHIAEGFAVGVYNARGVHMRVEGGAQERVLAARYRTWAQERAIDFPYVSSVLESIAQSYDRDAEWHDSEAKVRERLRH
jgi:addiction module HigA family antidote